jgi:curved DNA-binding protein CbpA
VIDAPFEDFYETLQVSPAVDSETLERVFRHLAKRYHPDNPESGDPERFNRLVEAFRVLSDPVSRAGYDARYEDERRTHWKIFGAGPDASDDERIRSGVLTALYLRRRENVDRPGMGALELERLTDCPDVHMKFHLWYLKESGLIQRQDNGTFSITVAGVDQVARAQRTSGGIRLLSRGDGEGGRAEEPPMARGAAG